MKILIKKNVSWTLGEWTWIFPRFRFTSLLDVQREKKMEQAASSLSKFQIPTERIS